MAASYLEDQEEEANDAADAAEDEDAANDMEAAEGVLAGSVYLGVDDDDDDGDELEESLISLEELIWEVDELRDRSAAAAAARVSAKRSLDLLAATAFEP